MDAVADVDEAAFAAGLQQGRKCALAGCSAAAVNHRWMSHGICLEYEQFAGMGRCRAGCKGNRRDGRRESE